MSPLQRKKPPPHLALKGVRYRGMNLDADIQPERVQVMTQLMSTLAQLNIAQGQSGNLYPGPGVPVEVIPAQKQRVLVAKYGLSRSQVIKAGGALAPYADKMVAELTSHQLAGREVVQNFDVKRDVWVYEVFEMQDVVPREAAKE